MARPILEVTGLSKSYRLGELGFTTLRESVGEALGRLRGRQAAEPREFWALRDVSFAVEPGEVVGVIGRNGAGKSTLLKILSRVTEATRGEIRLRGRVGSLLEVGTGFHPDLTGRENIYLNGAILGMKKAEIDRKFDEIVAFSETEQFLDTPVKRYSSGMYVRLAFAVAAHLEPEILIVDEVLAVGDQQFQRKCLGRMQEIAGGHGRTVLLVSHSMATIRRLCRRCLVLSAGTTPGLLPVDEAVEHYVRSAAPSAWSVDVSARGRDWGSEGRDARLLEVAVEGEEGLRFGRPLRLRLRVKAAVPVTGLMFGIAFTTSEGSRVLTLDSDGAGQLVDLAPGVHDVFLGLDRLPLHPGQYFVNAAIGSGRFFHDIIDACALWEVATSVEDRESDRSFGGCRMTPSCEVRPAGR